MENAKKTEDFTPKDSNQDQPEDHEVVKEKKDKTYKEKDANLENPAKKRKYSEQPPNKNNTKS